MRIVITYQHRGDDSYLPLIDMALASASRLGYETVMIGNVDAGDIHLDFPADKEPYLMNWILAAQIAYVESPLFVENSVFFSPDALITRRLEPVFDMTFDLGFTDRANSRWPINNGVIFMKPQRRASIAKFFREALATCKKYSVETQKWFGDQQSLHDVYLSGAHRELELEVKMLPCRMYNAAPVLDDVLDRDLMEDAYVVHMKGKRKGMMKTYWEALCETSLLR